MSESVLQAKVLQLMFTYEADGVITGVHADALIRRGAAEAIGPHVVGKLRSEKHEWDVPSIIRLKRYYNVRRRRQASGKRRFHIFQRDNFHCQYCGKKFDPRELTQDHIIPQSRDGSDDPENLATSCYPCNQRKGNRTPDEAGMRLLATPSALRYGLDRAVLVHHAEARPEWRDYLFLDGERVA